MFVKSWLRNWLREPGSQEASPPLDAEIHCYEVKLDDLSKISSSTTLLSVLVQRSQVAIALERAVIPPKTVQYLVGLDRRLRCMARQTPNADWDDWRQAINPSQDYWWWWLDEAHPFPWVLFSATLMVVALSLTVDITRRLWGGGPDWLATIVVIISILFTASPLTKQGPDMVEKLTNRIPRLAPRYQGMAVFTTAMGGLLIVLTIRFLGLPTLSRYYNSRGYEHLNAGKLTESRFDFQRAVNINPDHAAAYYNLADAYVQVSDYDQATSLYRQALAFDRKLDLAYNGLGYVLILADKPEQAISVLHAGLSVAKDDTARTALWTNLGRAYLTTKQYDLARVALDQAIALQYDQAEAHCTLALAVEALRRPEDEIALHWENCLRYIDRTTLRGQELATMARSHLQAIEEVE